MKENLMRQFAFEMPTKIVFGKDIFSRYNDSWKSYGKRLFIITGRNSAEKSGALKAVTSAAKENNQEYIIYNKVHANPVSTMIDEAAEEAKAFKPDFVVGIGGGSVLDSAKIVAALVLHPELKTLDMTRQVVSDNIPLICIPTTAGTGSELTPFTVVTVAEEGNKKMNMKTRIYPTAAWVNPEFTRSMRDDIRNHTLLDAICQLVEGILTTRSTPVTDTLSFDSLKRISSFLPAYLNGDDIPEEALETVLYSSSISGLVISQTGISLPHILSYNITDNFHTPHGMACAIFLIKYMRMHPEKQKVDNIVHALDFNSIDDFQKWVDAMLGQRPTADSAMLKDFAEDIMKQQERLGSFPKTLQYADIFKLYESACSIV